MKLSIHDIQWSFGEKLDTKTKNIFNSFDFSYKLPSKKERDHIILNNLNNIKNDTQTIAAEYRKKEWNDGWNENLNLYKNSKRLDSVMPKFIQPGQPLRFKQDFIIPNNPNFERDFIKVFQTWFFPYHMNSHKNIYEFGCGSGFNLIAIVKELKDKKIYGADFVDSSIELVNLIASDFGFNMSAFYFDMIEPNYDIALDQNSCILTFGSIEQLGNKFNRFIDYLIIQKVNLCLHVEPIIEFYDENNLIDYTAIEFHKKRGYAMGFFSHLKKLEKECKIEIINYRRLFFGSVRIEGYNYIVWKPIWI